VPGSLLALAVIASVGAGALGTKLDGRTSSRARTHANIREDGGVRTAKCVRKND